MRIRQWITPVVLTVGTLVLPAATQASDDPVKMERDAVARVSAANAVSSRHGYYARARAMAIDGDRSVRGRTAAWLEGMQAYIEGWSTALALSDLRAEMPYATFESELTKTLEAQSKKLAELSDEARRIDELAKAAAALLAKPEVIPAFAEQAQYQTVLDQLASRESELRVTLSDVGVVASGRVEDLGEIDSLSRRAILGRLKAALLEEGRYPLEETVSRVSALLAAEKELDPRLLRLEGAFTDMNTFNANLAFFHAQEAIGPAQSTCTDARAAANALPASTFVTAAKTRIESLCEGIASLYASLTGDTSITHAEYVEEYLRTERTKLGTACTTASPACEKLAVFAALTGDDLRKMDDARLRFVELGWGAAIKLAREN